MEKTLLKLDLDKGLLKALKALAMKRNIKLNALIKEILSEKKLDVKNSIADISKALTLQQTILAV